MEIWEWVNATILVAILATVFVGTWVLGTWAMRRWIIPSRKRGEVSWPEAPPAPGWMRKAATPWEEALRKRGLGCLGGGALLVSFSGFSPSAMAFASGVFLIGLGLLLWINRRRSAQDRREGRIR